MAPHPPRSAFYMTTMIMTMVLERYRHRYHNPAGWCYHHRRCRRPCCCWTKTMAPYYCSYSSLLFCLDLLFLFFSSSSTVYPFWLSLLCLVVVVVVAFVVVVNQFSCVFDSSFLLLCIFFDHVPSISLSLSLCVYAFQSSLFTVVVRNQ